MEGLSGVTNWLSDTFGFSNKGPSDDGEGLFSNILNMENVGIGAIGAFLGYKLLGGLLGGLKGAAIGVAAATAVYQIYIKDAAPDVGEEFAAAHDGVGVPRQPPALTNVDGAFGVGEPEPDYG